MRPSYVLDRIISLAFHWPSILTLVWCQLRLDRGESLFKLVKFEVALRLFRLLALLLHESSHVLAAGVCAALHHRSWKEAGRILVDWKLVVDHDPAENPRCGSTNVGLQMLWQLCPFWPAAAVAVMLPSSSPTPREDAVIRLAGALVSICLPVAVALFWQLSMSSALLPEALFGGTLSVALGALLSDLPWLSALLPVGCYACGNWGCLVPRQALGDKRRGMKLVPDVVLQLLSQVLEVVELRGAQAGGFTTFLAQGSHGVSTIRTRVVKSKRGSLGRQLFGKLQWDITLRQVMGWLCCRRRLKPLPVVLAQGHSRFGTSSAPAENETHPHQWLGPHPDTVWCRSEEDGSWHCKRGTEVCVTITHNGDFDGWKVHDAMVPNGLLGIWLSKVHYHTNTAKGDSPKLAGLMDLLVTQGMWQPSLRLAFIETVLHHVDEICGWESLAQSTVNLFPSPTVFAAMGQMMDAAFASVLREDPQQLCSESIAEVLAEDGALLFESESCPPEVSKVLAAFLLSGAALKAFLQEAALNFFGNDLLSAAWSFFHRAEGTFGISITCNLWPDKVVLAAKGQPVSLAFDVARPLVYWASEPASLATHWPSSPLKKAGQGRLDMMDAVGEALEVRLVKGACLDDVLEKLSRYTLPGTRLEVVPFLPLPGALDLERKRMDQKELLQEDSYQLVLRGSLLGSGHVIPLSAGSLESRWVKLHVPTKDQHRALLPTLQRPIGTDVVEADIYDIPKVLRTIEKAWSDPSSLNRISAQKFQKCLSFLLQKRGTKGEIDVLILGVENSLWLGQQFAADLTRVFPSLNVVAMSSNWVLGMLQKNHGHVGALNWAMPPERFKMAPHAIVLALSQSGTTYPTVWATRLLQGIPDFLHVFVMSGQFDTVLANSIGQDALKPQFSGNRFSTHCGIRPSEPSTVATIAMHHTLTKLLLFSAEHAVVRRGPESDSSQLKLEEVQDLQRLVSSFISAAEGICGSTQLGHIQSSEAREQLLQAAKYLSSHLSETYYATLIGAIYIVITVTAGYPILCAILDVIAAILQAQGISTEGWYFRVHHALAHLDSWSYVFLAAILMSLHRLFTGRRLWTRYMARTVVIVDSTVNYKLARAYLSKLKALTWRFTTFGVAGQNGLDHFVHEMTHLTQSEVILVAGRQDGRLGCLASAEAASLMSLQQARYIASRPNNGVEAISIGHNPFPGKPGLFAKTITLPTKQRPPFLSQQKLGTLEGPCPPGDVVQRFAAVTDPLEVTLHTGNTSTAQLFPWVDKNELAQLMGTKEVSMTFARDIVRGLLEKQAEELKINAAVVDPQEIFQDLTHPPVDTGAGAGPVEEWTPSVRFPTMWPAASPTEKGVQALGQPTATKTNSTATPRWDFPGGGPCRGKVNVSELMAAIRGSTMQRYIHGLQAQKRQQDMQQAHKLSLIKGPRAPSLLQAHFDAWKEFRRQAHETKRRVVNRLRRLQRVRSARRLGQESPPQEWRLKEIKRIEKARFMSVMGLSLPAVFLAWRTFARATRAAEGVLRPVSGATICGWLGQQAEGRALFSRLRTVEELYETRIAAAERLLAFFVLFHKAVQPLSRLPGLSFDLDRSESRLRVASTPAPVPFVEHLPPQSRAAHAMQRLEQLVKGWNEDTLHRTAASLGEREIQSKHSAFSL